MTFFFFFACKQTFSTQALYAASDFNSLHKQQSWTISSSSLLITSSQSNSNVFLWKQPNNFAIKPVKHNAVKTIENAIDRLANGMASSAARMSGNVINAISEYRLSCWHRAGWAVAHWHETGPPPQNGWPIILERWGILIEACPKPVLKTRGEEFWTVKKRHAVRLLLNNEK